MEDVLLVEHQCPSIVIHGLTKEIRPRNSTSAMDVQKIKEEEMVIVWMDVLVGHQIKQAQELGVCLA